MKKPSVVLSSLQKVTTVSRLALVTLLFVLSVSSLSGCGYNAIQTMDETVNTQWAQVENQLQRRADLIPNLVKVAKGYAKQEKEIFTNIANARARLGGALQNDDPEAAAEASAAMNSTLSRLLVVMENYPQLKSDQQFTRLMDELAGTENRLAVARMDYNQAVSQYNSYIRQFPNNVTANVIQAKPRKYFNAPESSNQVPEVDL